MLTVLLPNQQRILPPPWAVWMAMGAGGLAVLFGGGVLFEWALRDPATTGELLTHQLAQPLTAACLVGTGIGVLGAAADRSKRWAVTMRRIAAGGLLCVGVAVLAEYALGIDLGIDRFLFRDVVVKQTGAPFPGRPSIIANIEMLLIGLTLALDDAPERWGFAYAATATLAALLALMALVGYAYQAEELYDNRFYTSISVGGAAVAFLQCIGLLAMRPERGWVGQLGCWALAVLSRAASSLRSSSHRCCWAGCSFNWIDDWESIPIFRWRCSRSP